jgi:hypothetical protein
VHESRLITGIAAVFAGLTVAMAMLGIVYNPLLVVVAAMFAVSTYVLWEHGTGRLAARIYAGVERQAATNGGAATQRGGFGAGPRSDWRPPREGQRAREAWRASRAGQRRRRSDGQHHRRESQPRRPADSGPSLAEAYDILGVEHGADETAIRAAYRDRVKDVHPDTADGDEAEFKRVTSAYERLTDR